MEIQNKKLSEIRPDPDQPRKVKSQEAIEELAASMKTHGLISPIEVDEKGVIITGETRYRAARLLGWNEIPVKVIDRDENTMARQLSENMSRSDMNPLDIARAMAVLHKKFGGKGVNGSTTRVAETLGVSKQKVSDYLQFLEMGEDLKEALRHDQLARQAAVAIHRAPQEIQKELLQLVVQKKLMRESIPSLVNYYVKTKDRSIMKEIGTKNLSRTQIAFLLEQKSPGLGTLTKSNLEPGEALIEAATRFSVSMNTVRLEKISKNHYPQIALALSACLEEISKIKSLIKDIKNK